MQARDEKKTAANVWARRLIRSANKAFLSTIGNPGESDTKGWPATSLVTVAAAWDGSPILMLSEIAHHTQNILSDSRASLLFDGSGGFANPQEGPRVSVVGRLQKTGDKGLHARFLAHHPRAAFYAGFGDFAFYKMKVERFHAVGGFARALWIKKNKAVLAKKDWAEIAEHELGVLEHMNSDHAEAIALYGTNLLGKKGKHWTMIGCDPEGCDLRCGTKVHRLIFDSMVTDIGGIRRVLVDLAGAARTAR